MYRLVLVFVLMVLSMQDDAECPLCLEEMDISEINFKPCPCGYQVRPPYLRIIYAS